MLRFCTFSLICSCMIPLAHGSDQIPGAPQTRPIAIQGAVIHTVAGKDIDSGTVLFENGKFSMIGKSVAIPENAETIDANGKHLYPSLIDANTDIGLVEINSIRATIDSREIGDMNPNVRSAVAFNPDSELIPVNRANGVLIALTAPTGGILSGRSSLMMLDGWTWEDMTLKADTGMHIRWPRDSKQLKELDLILSQAARYRASRASEENQLPIDLRLEALSKVLDRSLPLIVDATTVAQIEAAVAFAQQRDLKLIILGGYQAPYCAELLKQAEVPVIVNGVYRVPTGRDLPYDDAYTLPKRLAEAGVKFCISAGGRFGASGVRNLPYNAATAAAFGLNKDEAIKAITLYPAEILAVDDRVGAIAIDKDATFFLADGDILETETQVELAFVRGRKVDLDNRHQQLYRKYNAKYAQLAEETRD
jgi:imidazolonepropionase-like amidohydrolase